MLTITIVTVAAMDIMTKGISIMIHLIILAEYLLVRITANTNNFLSQGEMAFKIRKSLDGVQSIIDECIKNYAKTGDIAALKIALEIG